MTLSWRGQFQGRGCMQPAGAIPELQGISFRVQRYYKKVNYAKIHIKKQQNNDKKEF